MAEGWVKIHRRLIEWEWFGDINTCHLFLYLVLKANHKDKSWQGIDIKRGQLVTSFQSLSEAMPLSIRQIRTSLDKLKSTGEVTSKATNKFTILTIEKYSEYQGIEGEVTSKATNKRQTNDKQMATTKECKNDNNEKNINNFEKFWESFGKVGSKKDAEKAYDKSIQNGVGYEEIIRGVEQYEIYRRANASWYKSKHASSWLNGERWKDEYGGKPKEPESGEWLREAIKNPDFRGTTEQLLWIEENIYARKTS